jgi:hypothetical protein
LVNGATGVPNDNGKGKRGKGVLVLVACLKENAVKSGCGQNLFPGKHGLHHAGSARQAKLSCPERHLFRYN